MSPFINCISHHFVRFSLQFVLSRIFVLTILPFRLIVARFFNMSLKWTSSWWTYAKKNILPRHRGRSSPLFGAESSTLLEEEGSGAISTFRAPSYKRRSPHTWEFYLADPTSPRHSYTYSYKYTHTYIFTSTCRNGAPTRVSANRLILADITDLGMRRWESLVRLISRKFITDTIFLWRYI